MLTEKVCGWRSCRICTATPIALDAVLADIAANMNASTVLLASEEYRELILALQQALL
jgi:hypothetical protein